MYGLEDLRGPWENSEALGMLAVMLSLDPNNCVTNPQPTLHDLFFVASRNQDH